MNIVKEIKVVFPPCTVRKIGHNIWFVTIKSDRALKERFIVQVDYTKSPWRVVPIMWYNGSARKTLSQAYNKARR